VSAEQISNYWAPSSRLQSAAQCELSHLVREQLPLRNDPLWLMGERCWEPARRGVLVLTKLAWNHQEKLRVRQRQMSLWALRGQAQGAQQQTIRFSGKCLRDERSGAVFELTLETF